ncbi:hypothetical protein [Sphingobium xenophagum]|uniref:hypothetical protein n=1 Tax=Sphingobium xenophagum TaxID=121428 RepID=UPI0010325048|nr:hypothetical protein [Sphingobium xenophagum]
MLQSFFKAVLTGTLAGVAFPAIFLVIAILGSSWSHDDLRSMIGITVMMIVIPFALVFLSSIAVGIPVTLIFKRWGIESETAYLWAGALTGFLVPGIILAIIEQNIDVFFRAVPAGILGALSGTITGRTWWRTYRCEMNATGGLN